MNSLSMYVDGFLSFLRRNAKYSTWKNRVERLYLRERVLYPFVAWVQGKRIVYLLHVNKTAGTSVFAAVQNLGRYSRSGYIVPLPHRFGFRDIPERYKVALFVRNPAARYASGFENTQRAGFPAYEMVLSSKEEMVFRNFPTFQELIDATNSSDPEKRALSESAWSTLFHLRMNYRHYFGDIDYLRSQLDRIVFVGEQEDFAEDWKRFFKKFYGKEVPLEEKNVLAKHREVLPGYREAIERIHPDEFLLYEEVLRRKAQLCGEELRSAEGGS